MVKDKIHDESLLSPTEPDNNDNNPPNTTRELKVNINYTGSIILGGMEDIYVRIYTNELMDGMSAASATVYSSNTGITFSGDYLKKCFLYAVIHTNSASLLPSPGDIHCYYNNKHVIQLPATPIYVEKGETKEIDFAFNDTHLWPDPGVINCHIDGAPTAISGTSCYYKAAYNSTSIMGVKIGASIEVISLSIPGNSPGTYNSPLGHIYYSPTAGQSYMSSQGAGNCTITVDSYGPVGGQITGTFSGVVDDGMGGTIAITNGTFDAYRFVDE